MARIAKRVGKATGGKKRLAKKSGPKKSGSKKAKPQKAAKVSKTAAPGSATKRGAGARRVALNKGRTTGTKVEKAGAGVRPKAAGPRAPQETDPVWDFSEIPRREWEWQVGKYERLSVVSERIGLRYWIDDFWAGRGGGSQSYETFLGHGPLHRMPDTIRDEIRALVLEHRRKGGVHLTVEMVIRGKSHRLWRAQLNFDENALTTVNEPAGELRETLFAGSVPKGKHVIGWVLVFEATDPMRKHRRVAYGETRVPFLKGARCLRLEVTDACDGAICIKAYIGGKKATIAGDRQLEYSADY